MTKMKPAGYLTWFYTMNQGVRFFLILSMIILIAYIDYLTPPEFSVRLLYLFPLFLSVWDGKGLIAGLCFSFICTLVYFYFESQIGRAHV